MRARTRSWRVTAVALLAAETAALFWAYYALGLGSQIRGAEQSPLVQLVGSQIELAVRSVFPAWLLSSFATFVSALGLASLSRSLVGIGSSLGIGGSYSSLGSAVVAPAYFAVRRVMRAAPRRPDQVRPRSVHWKIRPPMWEVGEPALSAQAAAPPAA